ncbi:MAG: hypothetical protein JXX14_10770 [Deltaproteobacteria bacterium]|nr:hypothetical protein [Deltaproteobacteria bacterium]
MKQPLFISLLLIFCMMACATTIQPGKPFDDSERRFFDDGIDVVEDVSSLQGQFGFEEREDMDARCNLADVVGVVEILSVHSNTGADGVEEIRIEVQVKELIYGEMTNRQIQLRSNANALGYTLLNRYESALSGSKILFMRTFHISGESDGTGHHFHLSPLSPAVLSEVKRLVKKRRNAESGKDKQHAQVKE